MHQTPAITMEPASILRRDTNAFARISLLAKTAKTLQTSACQPRVKMEESVTLTTPQGVSLVRAKPASLVQSVKRTLMNVFRVLAWQTLTARTWRMVTVASATLHTLETHVTYVSSKVSECNFSIRLYGRGKKFILPVYTYMKSCMVK